jgi:hypothetical protein
MTTTSTSSCPRPWSARSALPRTPRPSRPTQSPSRTAKPCAARTLSCGTKPWCARWRPTSRTARGNSSSCRTGAIALTTKWAALRAILALAALENLELESIDISNAYLNGELHDVDVYMQQPDGFAERDSTLVARLLKGLYGLKQGGREWFRRLEEVLVELGFARIRSDSSVFIWEKDGVKVIVPVFVDDITLASKSKEKIAEIKGLLAQRFKLRDLGPTSFLLGVQIDRERSARTLHISQRQYTLDLLDRFGFADCSPVSTPLDPGSRLDMSQCPQTPEDDEFMRDKPYVSAVGALLFLAIATRPDIAHAVSVLCRFMSKPGPAH